MTETDVDIDIETLRARALKSLTTARDRTTLLTSCVEGPDLTAQRPGQELVPQAEADIGLGPVGYPFTDRFHLACEPRIFLKLPHIHGAAQDEHQVEVLERGYLLAFPYSH